MTTRPDTTPESLHLTAGDYTATLTRTGATLCALTWRDRDLILPFGPAEGPQLSQGQVLLPWPNRIDRGRYTFDGVEYRLAVNETDLDTAIHGLTRHEPWTVASHTAERADLTYHLKGAPGYPGELELAVSYELSAEDGLTVAISATNIGTVAAPYGNGTHNFLTVGGTLDDATLRLPVAAHLPVNDRLIPAGGPQHVAGTDYDFRMARRIDGTVLDTAFTDVAGRDAEGRMWATLTRDGAGVALWADETYGWLQVFSADRPHLDMHRKGLAVEPMTCPPNAFASGVDLIVLDAGESHRSSYGVVAIQT